MIEDGTRQENRENRLRRLSSLLSNLARLMSEQSEFYSKTLMEAELESVQDASTLAENRLSRIGIAGQRWLREIEKTMITNLARAVLASRTVLDNAGPDAWPDLADAVLKAREEVGNTAQRDATFFMPNEFQLEIFARAEPAPFVDPQNWKQLSGGDCFLHVGNDSIPLAVVGWGKGDQKIWLAQAGGIGLGFHKNLIKAAKEAERAHAFLFSNTCSTNENSQLP